MPSTTSEPPYPPDAKFLRALVQPYARSRSTTSRSAAFPFPFARGRSGVLRSSGITVPASLSQPFSHPRRGRTHPRLKTRPRGTNNSTNGKPIEAVLANPLIPQPARPRRKRRRRPAIIRPAHSTNMLRDLRHRRPKPTTTHHRMQRPFHLARRKLPQQPPVRATIQLAARPSPQKSFDIRPVPVRIHPYQPLVSPVSAAVCRDTASSAQKRRFRLGTASPDANVCSSRPP